MRQNNTCNYRDAPYLIAMQYSTPPLKAGQSVRVKPSSPMLQHCGIDANAFGEIICLYNSTSCRSDEPVRMDVKFPADVILWGVPAKEFELVSSGAEADSNPA